MKNRLRVLRAERGWSQAELGARLGVSRQTLNAIETGKYDPSLRAAFALAALFGLKVEEVFDPEPEPAKVPDPAYSTIKNRLFTPEGT